MNFLKDLLLQNVVANSDNLAKKWIDALTKKCGKFSTSN